jgi:hypothetical protein
MNAVNTLNVGLGHLPFPQAHVDHIDLMVSPRFIAGPNQLAVVDDSLFGQNGSALSEYVQLLWLLDHLDVVTVGYSYLRIFHYRRFVSREKPRVGQRSTNLPWSTAISSAELSSFASEFGRFSDTEVFNTKVQFGDGMLAQYARAHVLEDILNFTKFLIEIGVFSSSEASNFLRESTNIPACNIGVFSLETFRSIFSVLRKGADFVHSPYFVVRQGYQRRSVGFLLERLNGYLILKMIRNGEVKANFGHNIVISDDAVVSVTL